MAGINLFDVVGIKWLSVKLIWQWFFLENIYPKKYVKLWKNEFVKMYDWKWWFDFSIHCCRDTMAFYEVDFVKCYFLKEYMVKKYENWFSKMYD